MFSQDICYTLNAAVQIMLYIFIIVFFSINKKTYSFVKGIFITGCSFAIFGSIFGLLIFRLRIVDFSYEDIFSYISVCINTHMGFMGYFLLIWGITLLIGKDYNNLGTEIENVTMHGKRRSIGISLLLFIVTLGIYFPFWLYRTVKDLKNNFGDEIKYSPGKAVGFLFIPFFNIFWGIYIMFSLPLTLKRIEEKHFGKNAGFYFHPVLIPVSLILFSLLARIQLYNIDKYTLGMELYFISTLYVFYLTIQAKLNVFFDYNKINEKGHY